MKSSYKNLLGVSTFTLLFAAAPALAQGVDVNYSGSNDDTGPGSGNYNTYDITNRDRTNVRNHAHLRNLESYMVQTGGNVQSNNTSTGSADTGSVGADTDWSNAINRVSSMSHLSLRRDVTADFSNGTTGPLSDNVNDLALEVSNALMVHNKAGITNTLGLSASTGNNTQVFNTSTGAIDTGNVNSDSMISNEANSLDPLSIGGGSTSVDIMAGNENTGPSSGNYNLVDVANRSRTTIKNHAHVDTTQRVSANTGDNTQASNTNSGDIDTGNVDVSLGVDTKVNQGTSVQNDSDVSVSGDTSNDTTGPGSTNVNDIDVSSNETTTVDNHAMVDNTATVDADTGGNTSTGNTSSGDIDTGSVNISSSVNNEVN